MLTRMQAMCQKGRTMRKNNRDSFKGAVAVVKARRGLRQALKSAMGKGGGRPDSSAAAVEKK